MTKVIPQPNPCGDCTRCFCPMRVTQGEKRPCAELEAGRAARIALTAAQRARSELEAVQLDRWRAQYKLYREPKKKEPYAPKSCEEHGCDCRPAKPELPRAIVKLPKFGILARARDWLRSWRDWWKL